MASLQVNGLSAGSSDDDGFTTVVRKKGRRKASKHGAGVPTRNGDWGVRDGNEAAKRQMSSSDRNGTQNAQGSFGRSNWKDTNQQPNTARQPSEKNNGFGLGSQDENDEWASTSDRRPTSSADSSQGSYEQTTVSTQPMHSGRNTRNPSGNDRRGGQNQGDHFNSSSSTGRNKTPSQNDQGENEQSLGLNSKSSSGSQRGSTMNRNNSRRDHESGSIRPKAQKSSLQLGDFVSDSLMTAKTRKGKGGSKGKQPQPSYQAAVRDDQSSPGAITEDFPALGSTVSNHKVFQDPLSATDEELSGSYLPAKPLSQNGFSEHQGHLSDPNGSSASMNWGAFSSRTERMPTSCSTNTSSFFPSHSQDTNTSDNSTRSSDSSSYSSRSRSVTSSSCTESVSDLSALGIHTQHFDSSDDYYPSDSAMSSICTLVESFRSYSESSRSSDSTSESFPTCIPGYTEEQCKWNKYVTNPMFESSKRKWQRC